ncbi:MAG: DUF4326 domain-containing protein [Candidatus Rokubacteria bacterium]|nr:DUF4326 domain-containing protein [Candidatus Rokubacteria bacterium]
MGPERHLVQPGAAVLTTVVNVLAGPYDVYIGRTGRGRDGYFGNPFRIGAHGSRAQVLERFRQYFRHRLASDPAFRTRVEALRGKRLGCFCKPLTCHGDIIADHLNSGGVA